MRAYSETPSSAYPKHDPAGLTASGASSPKSAAAITPAERAAAGAAALAKFREANWDFIPLELTRYAVFKIQRLRWKTAQGLPRGVFAQDLAQGAIQKTLAGVLEAARAASVAADDHESAAAAEPGATPAPVRGIRRWDPEREPDLLNHLKSVIDSDIYSLVHLEEHQLNDYHPDLNSEDAAAAFLARVDREGGHGLGDEPGASGADASDGRVDPETQLLRRESSERRERRQTQLLQRLQEACANDEEETKLLLAYAELADADEPAKPALAAQRAGLTDSQARNARRRIERKARMLAEASAPAAPRGLTKSAPKNRSSAHSRKGRNHVRH